MAMFQVVVVRIFILLGIAFSLFGCRTVSPRVENGAEHRADNGANADYHSEPIQLTKRRMETPTGFSDLALWARLDLDDSVSTKRVGIVRCRLDAEFTSCLIESQSLQTLIDNGASRLVRQRLIDSRHSIEMESQIVADAICEMAGGSMPPYSDRDAKCRFERIRASNEVVFSGNASFGLAELLLGDESIVNANGDVSGLISCRVLQRGIRAECSVRRMLRGTILDDAHELRRIESIEVSEAMIETVNEIRKSQQRQGSSGIPIQIDAAIRCLSADKKSENDDRLEVHCFGRL